jgi:hypothetical protein
MAPVFGWLPFSDGSHFRTAPVWNALEDRESDICDWNSENEVEALSGVF